MLRFHLMQQWYDLSDPAMEDALIEEATNRRFASIALITERIPDKTTAMAFLNLLEKNDLGKQIIEAAKAHLKANSMAIKHGTIISARCSTKNEKRERDLRCTTRHARASNGTMC
jgi:IS5 family transposase